MDGAAPEGGSGGGGGVPAPSGGAGGRGPVPASAVDNSGDTLPARSVEAAHARVARGLLRRYKHHGNCQTLGTLLLLGPAAAQQQQRDVGNYPQNMEATTTTRCKSK